MSTLSILEPGISNSVANVTFELCVAKIAKLRLQLKTKIIKISEAENLITDELRKAKEVYQILVDGSEGRNLMENRLRRIVDFSSELFN